jgi:hypothetical protein
LLVFVRPVERFLGGAFAREKSATDRQRRAAMSRSTLALAEKRERGLFNELSKIVFVDIRKIVPERLPQAVLD